MGPSRLCSANNNFGAQYLSSNFYDNVKIFFKIFSDVIRDLLRGIGQPTMERGSWRIEFVNVWARTELPTHSQTSHDNTLQNQLFVDGLGMKASLPCSC